MELTREEILTSRIVDEEATAHDWAELTTIAEADAGVWKRLAESQREHAALRMAVEERVSAADAIALPAIAGEPAERALTIRFRSWSGWAAAAAVALVWASVQGVLPQMGRPGSGPMTAGWSMPQNTNQAFDQYRDVGQREGVVVGELPKELVEYRQATGGGLEVIYVRRVLERAIINGAYEFGRDDQGNAVVIPVDVTPITVGDPL